MPDSVRVAMQLQVEAERKKRASILESEGQLFIVFVIHFWDSFVGNVMCVCIKFSGFSSVVSSCSQ